MPKKRVNGFERPLDVHQVVSWVAFALLLAAFFGLHTPVRTAPLGIALTVIYTVLAATVVASAAKCMRVDPRDEGAAPGCPTQRWCSYCAKQVNERSKHCRRCNKCVEVFDHHCPWLNTCIGRHNYAYFLVLLCSVFALLSVQIASGLQVDAPTCGAACTARLLHRPTPPACDSACDIASRFRRLASSRCGTRRRRHRSCRRSMASYPPSHTPSSTARAACSPSARGSRCCNCSSSMWA